MKAHVVINTKAGAAFDTSIATIEQSIIDGLVATTKQLRVSSVAPENIETAIKKAAHSNIDTLVVAGGDGTIRTAASHLINTDKTLGIIPLGTFNRLANELHIPLAIPDAVKMLVQGKQKYIDVADLNGKIFLCNSIIGLLPKFSEERQKLRGLSLRRRALGYLSTLNTILTQARPLSMHVDDGHLSQKRRALTVIISNNVYRSDRLLSFERQSFDKGELGFYISQHRSLADLSKIFFYALLGKWQEDENLEVRMAQKFYIDISKRKVRVSNDGEVEKFKPPLVYKTFPRALKVITPNI